MIQGQAGPAETAALQKDVPSYFAKPVQGWSSGVLHSRNAVDVANACGTPVYAAADGLVLDAARSGWNGGYGSYVYMEHPNGAKTKYAHLASVAVEIGDYLKQGDKIGAVGRTGEATGCHLHFEVEGAANPIAKQ
jgi:lysostaphin